MSDIDRTPIGKTTTTYQIASTVDEYFFWIKDGVEIQPYDFVTAVDGAFCTVGTVAEIANYTDAVSHLSNRIVSEISGTNQLERLSATVAKVTVFHSYILQNGTKIGKRYPVSSGADVFISDETEIIDGLNAGGSQGQTYPAGIISRTSGEDVVVPLQSDYLIGPESAHMNVSGISGLATKTSYMMFLLYSINRLNPGKFLNIIFNLKGADLMNIDVRNDSLDSHDLAVYKLIFGDESPEPFKKVRYLQPRGPDGEPSSFSSRKEEIYAFSFEDVYCDLDLLFSNVRDDYHTAESFNRFISRDWNDRNRRWELNGSYQKAGRNIRVNQQASNWHELMDILDNHSDEVSGFYGLYPTTVNRIKRELARLTHSSIFVDQRSRSELFIREVIRDAEAGQSIVIDIAKLGPNEQTFVVGEIFRELNSIIYQENEESAKKAIVVVDELNSIAPANQQSPLKEQIIEIARKGRSVGYIIFGAEQFASEVDNQIIGNSSLRVLGRTSSMEISSSAFRNFTQQEKNTVMMLRKGEMLISFPTFRANVKILFPRPPYKTNRR